MPALVEMLSGAEALEDGFALAITPDWQQGRTAYGGLTSALAVEAARRVLPEPLPLRSAQFSMIAPLVGRIEARAKIVRAGRNAVWVTAELVGEKGTGFLANCVFMHPRESVLALGGYALPDGLVPLEDAPVFETKVLPAFMQMHFDVRVAVPADRLQEADLCWWVRVRERDGLDADVEAVLLGDALPPAVLPHLPPRTPVSSMQWHVNMLNTAARPRDGWWLIRSTSRQSGHGLASEDILQWGEGGTPAVTGMQSVAVFA
ncbi:thioesterase family protein [Novosphingobium mangrovi (ex Hu et al. 2023)]|uniref:Thioesterase family protein n=1 Tax=Novosphingobium mangrovi (ex Hu et al. 2023) TaxID=2930094 RepID=A0ABT0ABL4_9SPHN|nr:thioesterase family protein [Novosphingobium mangrovi (ex Hu et al. 2023)]MCJ1960588.1 thioesterase family protein [Novosphingobium mangrovi (ex Hu et al. 2023)]